MASSGEAETPFVVGNDSESDSGGWIPPERAGWYAFGLRRSELKLRLVVFAGGEGCWPFAMRIGVGPISPKIGSSRGWVFPRGLPWVGGVVHAPGRFSGETVVAVSVGVVP